MDSGDLNGIAKLIQASGINVCHLLETITDRAGREGFDDATELALLRRTWAEALRAAGQRLIGHDGIPTGPAYGLTQLGKVTAEPMWGYTLVTIAALIVTGTVAVPLKGFSYGVEWPARTTGPRTVTTCTVRATSHFDSGAAAL